jgi:hypothetical protein
MKLTVARRNGSLSSTIAITGIDQLSARVNSDKGVFKDIGMLAATNN